MNIIIRPNNERECFDLVDADSDQSHDDDGAVELIARVYDRCWAELILKLLKHRMPLA